MAVKTNEVDPQIVEYFLDKVKTSDDIFGDSGVMKALKKALTERILEGELTTELGYEKHACAGKNTGNSRNGYSSKRLKTTDGEMEINVPRDRNNDFEPLLIPKNQTRFPDMDEKIISLYSRGMSTRDIQEQLLDLYGTEVSPTLISNVTNEVIDEVKAWQSRPLDRLYPIVYLDALVIKVQQDKRIINKAFYLALGVNVDGQKELLGIWVSQNEGAKFWLNVLTELKNRGVEDILIACVDGLTGFPEAIHAAYPNTQVQLCIVHMVRNSLRYVGWKKRKEVAADLRTIYTAKTLEEAELALSSFSEKWDSEFPSISRSWLNHWESVTPFFDYPDEIRKVIYTTNAIESLNMSIRKVIKNKRVFPSDEAALKLLYLALKNISKKWTMPIRDWGAAMNQFMIMFEDRISGRT
ncbi:MAG: IS256 family transposase [Legionellales bacterium]|nr:IS256 family transposase [Legionellales bacterium]MAZ40026.1 IS256 family transposase [Legionellales bacterium]MAZ40136.1 IS256 family transposase [Legionellales bacterium]MAZ40217.1 IS256 family transposase [Legionellales bacterium]|tara:strand:+ start:69 stop:1301 length:1233 start_codon:yes stop_codon:yes gene_type:complete